MLENLKAIILSSGLAEMTVGQGVMILVSFSLMYLAIKKKYEPLLLLPLAFGALLTNLPLAGLMSGPSLLNGKPEPGGLLYYLYQGVELGIYPPLFFLGLGAMIDFGPLLANPKRILLGAAAQLGIFVGLLGALGLGFDLPAAGSIGMIGGVNGPAAVFLTNRLQPDLLGPVAIAAYSYMALIPFILPCLMRLLVPEEERRIVMEQPRSVSRKEKILFPIIGTVVGVLLLPSVAPLLGALMFGNLLRVSGVADRLAKTAENELLNIITIFLGLAVGAKANAEQFLTAQTLRIFLLGLVAFAFSTIGGLLFGRLMCKLSGGKVNPLIGAAGIPAVPVAARVVEKVGAEEDPDNNLLLPAMGPNGAGVIGTLVAVGLLLALLG